MFFCVFFLLLLFLLLSCALLVLFRFFLRVCHRPLFPIFRFFLCVSYTGSMHQYEKSRPLPPHPPNILPCDLALIYDLHVNRRADLSWSSPIPEGVIFTVVMDSRHSGSVTDLPFSIVADEGKMEARLSKLVSSPLSSMLPRASGSAT